MQRLGVIGGMGPDATSYYYEEVIAHTKASCDQEHIDMVILNKSSMPDRTRAILTGEHEALLGTMKECVEMLTLCGCGNIAIPCNTSHFFYDKIQAMTNVPIIHMPRESARYAAAMKEGVKRIGIMGTDGTVRAGVYHKECEALGLEAVSPDEEAQKAVMSLIYDDVKSGKPGDPEKFRLAYENLMSKGCDVIILACTEISVFKRNNPVPKECLDAMDVLVRESILRSGAAYVEE